MILHVLHISFEHGSLQTLHDFIELLNLSKDNKIKKWKFLSIFTLALR